MHETTPLTRPSLIVQHSQAQRRQNTVMLRARDAYKMLVASQVQPSNAFLSVLLCVSVCVRARVEVGSAKFECSDVWSKSGDEWGVVNRTRETRCVQR